MSDQTPTTPDSNWLNTLTGSRIRIRTSSADTDGRLCVIEYIEPPHSSPPVYTRHEFIEVFCVVKGVLSFKFEEEPYLQLSAGQSITCPSWKPHSFWNETDDPVHALLVCTPAGLDEFFIKSDQLLSHTPRPSIDNEAVKGNEASAESLAETMKALRTEYGLEHVGKPPLPSGGCGQ